jgi:flagellar protein FlbD
VILLTRFHSGERFGVNPDLIERVEETPDTVITLTNGAKHVVQESIDEISESVQIFKAATLALATRMVEDPSLGATAHLRIVQDTDDDDGNGPTGPRPTDL